MRINRDHWLYQIPFTHKGLHNDQDAPENTLQAFRLAIEKGYGIELDVQLSRDAEVMVFHDALLERLTNGCGPIKDKIAQELGQLSVKNTDQTIPTLAEVLALVDGKFLFWLKLKA